MQGQVLNALLYKYLIQIRYVGCRVTSQIQIRCVGCCVASHVQICAFEFFYVVTHVTEKVMCFYVCDTLVVMFSN